jgi:hypothetical protein
MKKSHEKYIFYLTSKADLHMDIFFPAGLPPQKPGMAVLILLLAGLFCAEARPT